MSAITVRPATSPAISLAVVVEHIRSAEPRYFATALLMLAAMAPTAFAALADQREFLGVDIWLKPLKFEFALLVYLGTLSVFALFVPAETKAKAWYRWFVGAVCCRRGRGDRLACRRRLARRRLAFQRDADRQMLYPLMGLAAILLSTAEHRLRRSDRAQSVDRPVTRREGSRWSSALRWCCPLTLVTAGTMSGMGTHFIGGTASDAGGFPVMGWSRDGGDLRVAHFFATHALHFIPAFGLVSGLSSAARMPVRPCSAFPVRRGLHPPSSSSSSLQALFGLPFLAG